MGGLTKTEWGFVMFFSRTEVLGGLIGWRFGRLRRFQNNTSHIKSLVLEKEVQGMQSHGQVTRQLGLSGFSTNYKNKTNKNKDCHHTKKKKEEKKRRKEKRH